MKSICGKLELSSCYCFCSCFGKIANDDAKNLCTAEENVNGFVSDQGYRNEEGSDGWFQLMDSKRRKTSV